MAFHFRVRTSVHLSFWVAAGLTGLLAVGYAKLVAYVQGVYFDWFEVHPYLMSLLTPGAFVAATFLVVRFAPEAKGSGIPQVLEASRIARLSDGTQQVAASRLVSTRTAFVKVISSIIGIIGGASIGREGPTVQIAAWSFARIGALLKKFVPRIDYSSFLVAGGAAGIAAAFNTPLAGITFALEEMADGAFGPMRQAVMLSVIIAGITAQALVGDYLYFGQTVPQLPDTTLIVTEALLIGAVGGAAGALFAWGLISSRFPLPNVWWKRALVCGALVSLVTLLTHGDTAGSGYEVTRAALESDIPTSSLGFPLWKVFTTILSQISGMAGGIFSPSLSIGAGIGFSIAHLANFVNFKACALIGMVAFFSGAIQAPLTGVVIVMEMTNERALIIPFMIAAFLAQAIGRRFIRKPLYQYLALQHRRG
jgi:chloride channel protein, CIC family